MRRITVTGLSLIGAVLAALTFANAQSAKPLDSSNEHLGVATCSNSTCHSKQAPTGSTVRQNEIITWQDAGTVTGAHSRAYSVLLSKQGRAIARNLGISAAEKSGQCLSCHADNVSTAERGASFNVAEGVTCEACHGGAEQWLTSHYTPGATHADNVSKGLYPLDDVQARASLCLDCHYGSERKDQFVTHRIMGAGHPRMSFELDLFTALQSHHDVDADYLERKADVGGFKTWAIGQAMAMARGATLFANDDLAQDGLFPELYFFDCHACHQTISNDPKSIAGWRPNPGRPLGPGVPVYNDSNAIMLRAVTAEIAPARANELGLLVTRLHVATRNNRSATRAAARELATFGKALEQDFLNAQFDQSTAKAVLNRILKSSLTKQYTNYAAGEQAVSAVDTFLNAMVAQGYISEQSIDLLQPALDKAYDAVESPNRFNPGQLRSALEQIAQTTRDF